MAKNKQIAIPMRDLSTTVILVDARDLNQVCTLHGILRIPLTLMVKEGQVVRWRIPEFKIAPKGLVTDIQAGGLCLTFPFIEKGEGEGVKGQYFSFDDMINLFKAFEPKLIELNRGVR